ncbi:MAG: hypothetical protein OXF50_02865 [Caldilineaceae bacterium]|nr:hypothetical protein [Caldilineaceae bacterium]MCY3990151.1 hypothetical protein [Caldilineaceae bacterium]
MPTLSIHLPVQGDELLSQAAMAGSVHPMISLGKRLLARVTERVFVFTLLWIGFVCAISFMETPLKFQAPSLTLPVALEIGHLVFHALNTLEIGLASAITAITLLTSWPRRIRVLTFLIGLLLATQTILLYTVLDARTLAIIHGLEVPERSFHPFYVALEGVKVVLLLFLTYLQLEEYEARIRRTAQFSPETAND